MRAAKLQHLLGTLAVASAASIGNGRGHGISKDDFIKVDGLRLYDSTGALHYLTGILPL